MAHMNQAKKAVIAAEIKKVVPKDWKYSLSVHNYSSLVMTIKSAPINLILRMNKNDYFDPEVAKNAVVNPYHYERQFADKEVAAIIGRIIDAMNTGNWDRSDIMTDYFDVGHYIEITIGRWDKPFVCTAEKEAA